MFSNIWIYNSSTIYVTKIFKIDNGFTCFFKYTNHFNGS